MSQPDELAALIARHLELDWEYIEYVPAWDASRIAEVRAAGRRAGRLLGYKIVTRQTDPKQRDDGQVVVIVAVREPPSAEDAARLAERSRLLMDEMWRGLPPENSEGT